MTIGEQKRLIWRQFRLLIFLFLIVLIRGSVELGVVTQYNSHPLSDIVRGWGTLKELGISWTYFPLSALFWHWYEGTADAVFQNIVLFEMSTQICISTVWRIYYRWICSEVLICQHAGSVAKMTLAAACAIGRGCDILVLCLWTENYKLLVLKKNVNTTYNDQIQQSV